MASHESGRVSESSWTSQKRISPVNTSKAAWAWPAHVLQRTWLDPVTGFKLFSTSDKVTLPTGKLRAKCLCATHRAPKWYARMTSSHMSWWWLLASPSRDLTNSAGAPRPTILSTCAQRTAHHSASQHDAPLASSHAHKPALGWPLFDRDASRRLKVGKLVGCRVGLFFRGPFRCLLALPHPCTCTTAPPHTQLHCCLTP